MPLREVLRQRLALLDREWMALAQSEELQSILRPPDPVPAGATEPPAGEQEGGK